MVAVAYAGARTWLARGLARYRQWLGRYDERTEAWFRHAWQRSGDVADLLQYLQFRRECGRLPTPDLISALHHRVNALQGPALRQAAERLLEAGAMPAEATAGLGPRLSPWAAQSPPIAVWLGEGGVELEPEVRRLADWHRQQPGLREAFGAYLRGQDKGICVVGNAGSLVGGGLGEHIDRHGLVVRFNRYRSEAAAPVDLGRRLDVWVCAPKFLPEAAAMAQGRFNVVWLVLSGPDVRYHRAGAALDWAHVAALLHAGVKVITVPLGVWGGLVDRLGAPPSAGILMLSWVHALRGDWDGLMIAGFDGARVRGHAYHHAGRGRPGRRHAWDRERALLADWRRQGLRALGASVED